MAVLGLEETNMTHRSVVGMVLNVSKAARRSWQGGKPVAWHVGLAAEQDVCGRAEVVSGNSRVWTDVIRLGIDRHS